MKMLIYFILVGTAALVLIPKKSNVEGKFFKSVGKKTEKKIDPLFQQTYIYLAAGAECYVYASEDQRFVLKFFRKKPLVSHWLLERMPSFLLPVHVRKTIIKKKRRRSELLTNYRNALQLLSQETGLLDVNVEQAAYFPIKIIDKYGKCHDLNLGDYAFAIQVRCQAFLQGLIDEDKGLFAAKLQAFFGLLRTKLMQQCFDADSGLNHNYGWLNGRAVQIDVGRLMHTPQRNDASSFYKTGLQRFYKKLHKKISLSAPHLLTTLDELFAYELQREVAFNF